MLYILMYNTLLNESNTLNMVLVCLINLLLNNITVTVIKVHLLILVGEYII